MTRKQGTTRVIDVKALLDDDGDYLRAMVRAIVEATLEAEMTAALGAEKGERTRRLGYRSGSYTRALITRVGTLELRVPQDRDGRFSTRLFAGDHLFGAASPSDASPSTRPPAVSMKATISGMPTPSRTWANWNGRSPRIRRESRSMTSSEAPTCGARSILLMMRRSERVTPGPPLRGILSPAETSMT